MSTATVPAEPVLPDANGDATPLVFDPVLGWHKRRKKRVLADGEFVRVSLMDADPTLTDARRGLLALASKIAPGCALAPEMDAMAIKRRVVGHRLNEPDDGRRSDAFVESCFATLATYVQSEIGAPAVPAAALAAIQPTAQAAPAAMSVGDAAYAAYVDRLTGAYRDESRQAEAVVQPVVDAEAAQQREAARRRFVADSQERKTGTGAYAAYVAGLNEAWR